MKSATLNRPNGFNGDLSDEKRGHIIKYAKRIFMKEGYSGASLEKIAKSAKVSKMTIYRKFGSKENLFIEIINLHCEMIYDTSRYDPAASLEDAEQALIAFGRIFIDTITRPEVFDMYRLLVGEMSRFGELGRKFYDAGPAETLAVVEHILSGSMPPADAKIRANAFINMTLGDAYQRYLLEKVDLKSAREQFDAQILLAARLVTRALS